MADPTEPVDPGEPAGSEPGGLDHLQAAVSEVIAAARALLDVAEELISDPRTADTIASALGSFTKAATRAAATGRKAVQNDGHAGSGASGDEDDGGGVQRIPVS